MSLLIIEVESSIKNYLAQNATFLERNIIFWETFSYYSDKNSFVSQSSWHLDDYCCFVTLIVSSIIVQSTEGITFYERYSPLTQNKWPMLKTRHRKTDNEQFLRYFCTECDCFHLPSPWDCHDDKLTILGNLEIAPWAPLARELRLCKSCRTATKNAGKHTREFHTMLRDTSEILGLDIRPDDTPTFLEFVEFLPFIWQTFKMHRH